MSNIEKIVIILMEDQIDFSNVFIQVELEVPVDLETHQGFESKE